MAVDVTPVRYRPHDDGYRLAVEVLDAGELRRRVASDPRRGFERVDFQCLLFVRSGTYTHTVDFETHRCTAGSCLLIGPGQVHRFGPASDWDGWLLIVAPHHVPDEIERLTAHVRIAGDVADSFTEAFTRMVADASSAADPAHRDELLALQAQLLVKRLAAGHIGADAGGPVDRATMGRYRAYRAAVEENFRRWHLVPPYARHLGCSTKSLDRACREMADLTAKRVIVERIVLEARRLLAHGADPVAAISEQLGFDEPTNFVKYFRRETGLTPAQFRRSLLAGGEG